MIFWSPSMAHPLAVEAKIEATRAGYAAARAEGEVTELRFRLDRLALTTEALWSLLRDRVGITEDQLLARVREVDLSDGSLDGSVRHPTQACPRCHRLVAIRNVACIYCGAGLREPPFVS